MWLEVLLRREFKQRFYLPSAGWMLIGLPLLSLLFFQSLIGDGRVRELSVVVCDLDSSPLSRELIRELDSSPQIDITQYVGSPIDAQKSVLRGECYGVVVVSEGFERAVMRGERGDVVSLIVGTNLTANGLISNAVRSVTSTIGVGLGVKMQVAQGVDLQQSIARFRPIGFTLHPIYNPTLSYRVYLLPPFLFLALILFTLVNTIYSVGGELRRATSAEWIRFADYSFVKAFVGKLLPIFLLSFTHFQLVCLVIMSGNQQMQEVNLWAVEIAGILLILSYQSLAILFVTLTSSLRFALSLGGGYGVMAFSFSGVTFPREAMWHSVGWLSELFPYTWFMRLWGDFTSRSATLLSAGYGLAVLASFTLLGVVAVAVRRRVYLDSKYWGRD